MRAWKFTEWGEQFPVDMVVERADPAGFEALLLPGGVINPDVLRMSQTAMAFVRHFFDANKPVASICHGPWSIIEVGAARGRRMTSWPSIRTDLRNAGAEVSTRPPSSIATWSPAAARRTFRSSTAKWSRCSRTANKTARQSAA